jgi:hypothetical protein
MMQGMEKIGWAAAGYNDADWAAVKTARFPFKNIGRHLIMSRSKNMKYSHQ